MENFNQIESNILDKIKNIKDRNSHDLIKSEIFGKKGIITSLFQNISSLNQDQKKEYASKLNSLKTKVARILDKKLTDFDQLEINKKLQNEKIDVLIISDLRGRILSFGRLVVADLGRSIHFYFFCT